MFDNNIELILKKKADEIVFIELKEGKTYQFNGATLDHTMPLPLMLKNIVDQVQGISESDIHLKSILEGMSFILGIDTAFPYKEAYMTFMKQVDPQLQTHLMMLADIAIEESRLLDAIIFLKCAWEFDKNNEQLMLNYARCCETYSREQASDKAIEKTMDNEAYEVLLNLSERFPYNAEVLYSIGFHLVNRKSFKAAQGVWEKAVELGLSDDQQIEILQNLTHLWSKIQFEEGYLLILDGFPDEGLTKLLPLEEDNPDWWNLMFFIGLAYRQKEDYENAIFYYKKTLNLNTGHVDTFNEIGLCYMSMTLYAEAEEYFEEALRLQPNHCELLCNLGIVHLKLGRIEMARASIEKAYEIDPSDEVTQAWLRYIQQV